MVNSRAKGIRAELALSKYLREQGYEFARRGQQHSGIEGEDVVGVPGHHVECKWDEALNVDKAMAQAIRDGKPDVIPIVVHRKTLERSAERKARFYRHWKVTMRAEDYFDMVERTEQLKGELEAERVARREGGDVIDAAVAGLEEKIRQDCWNEQWEESR
ncbi:hypothetical protein [Methanogenium cariaci]